VESRYPISSVQSFRRPRILKNSRRGRGTTSRSFEGSDLDPPPTPPLTGPTPHLAAVSSSASCFPSYKEANHSVDFVYSFVPWLFFNIFFYLRKLKSKGGVEH